MGCDPANGMVILAGFGENERSNLGWGAWAIVGGRRLGWSAVETWLASSFFASIPLIFTTHKPRGRWHRRSLLQRRLFSPRTSQGAAGTAVLRFNSAYFHHRAAPQAGLKEIRNGVAVTGGIKFCHPDLGLSANGKTKSQRGTSLPPPAQDAPKSPRMLSKISFSPACG